MCPARVPPRSAAADLLEEVTRAEAIYRRASREQFYLAIRRYTDSLQRFNRDMHRRKRQRSIGSTRP